jgi:hypothetical protein
MYNRNGHVPQAEFPVALASKRPGNVQWCDCDKIGGTVTLHNAIWVWGGTVMLALFALAFLFLIHGQGMVALGLFFGANVIGILVWLLTTSFRRAYPPEEEKEENGPPLLDRLNEEE